MKNDNDDLIVICIEGQYAIDELKPRIEKNRILFPMSAKCEYIKEDGLSFGYPGDYGWFTIITYDYTVGTLTDDTIELARRLRKKPQRPHVGTNPMESYKFTDEQRNRWKANLDSSWVEAIFDEFRNEGLTNNDDKDSFIDGQLNNYNCWPQEWKEAYDTNWINMNSPIGNKREIVVNDVLTLYIDDNEDYYFSTPYHDHGRLTKADKNAAIEYIKEFERYQNEKSMYKSLVNTFKSNMKLLKETLTNGIA